MIELILFIPWFVVMAGLVTTVLVRLRANRIEATRENIERLERELFPEWFPKPPPTNFSQVIKEHYLGPGGIWNVENASDIIATSTCSYVRTEVSPAPREADR